jgi:peroxin-7
LIHKNHFISSSWDSSIKVWDPLASSSILTLRGHVGAVYSVSYSPKLSTVFASASSDSSIKLWDERSNTCSSSFFTNSGEVLSIDWNKYQPNVIISGSVDKSVKVWDLRNPSVPRNSIVAHDFAVRRVKCSPHSGNVIATASYDATMKLFDILTGQQLFLNNAHSEFVFGVDFNLFRRGLVATCGWDGKTIILECPV